MSNLQLIQLFIVLGAAQGLLLAFVIFKRSRKSLATRLLALGLLLFSIRLAIYPFREISQETSWLWIAHISLLLLLLVGPAIYLFIRLKTRNRQTLRPVFLLHLFPFALYLIHSIFGHFYIGLDCSYATLASGTFYGGLSIWEVYFSHRTKQVAKYSTGWLYSLALPLLIAPLSIVALVNYSRPMFGFHPATIPYLVLTVGLYRMGFLSMVNFKAFNQQLFEPTKRKVSGFDSQKLKSLLGIVEQQQLYLQADISLQALSIETGLSRHEISEVLNQGLGKTFNQFINQYRVEEVKRKLIDDQFQHLSIVGIAMESGFSSKSAFHQIFKEFTGSTPNEFKKQCLSK